MAEIQVTHVSDDQFLLNIRGHELLVDQPISDGGSDSGPTPTELFVAGLASCVGHYARRFLARHGLSDAGLRVTAEWEMADDRPARVGRIDLCVQPPAGLPEERRAAFLAVASHCTVHNSITQQPDVLVRLVDAAGVAA